MANTINFRVDSISSDRQTAVVHWDETTNMSGKLFIKAYKVNQDTEETQIDSTPIQSNVTGGVRQPTNLDPVVEVSLNVDGWYRISGAEIEDYDPNTSYNQYDAVYFDASIYEEGVTGVYTWKMDYPSEIGEEYGPGAFPALWQLIEDPVRLAYNVGESNESLNIASGIYDVILSPNTEYEYAKYIASLGKEICSVDCSLENLEKIIRIATIIDGMSVRNDRSEMPAGERLARRCESIISQLYA